MPQTVFDTQDAVPADLRSYYIRRADGKWVFDHAQFDGIAQLVVPGLEANRAEWQANRDRERTRAEAAEQRAISAENALAAVKAPGTVVMTEADARLATSYRELGPLPDVKAKLAQFEAATTELAALKRADSIRTIATQCGLDAEVLTDALKLRAAEAELFSKSETVKDSQGKPQQVNVAYLRTKKPGEKAGTFVEQETPLFDYAKQQQWPSYVLSGMTKSPATQQAGQQSTPGQQQQRQPLTNYSSTQPAVPANNTANAQDPNEIAARFNARRSSVRSPFAAPQAGSNSNNGGN